MEKNFQNKISEIEVGFIEKCSKEDFILNIIHLIQNSIIIFHQHLTLTKKHNNNNCPSLPEMTPTNQKVIATQLKKKKTPSIYK